MRSGQRRDLRGRIRNSEGNEYLRKGGTSREIAVPLVRCAGAISVNHRVITAPIIRCRDRSAEEENEGEEKKDEEGKRTSGPRESVSGELANLGVRFTLGAPSFPPSGPRLRRSRSLREIGNRHEKVSIIRATEYVAIIFRPVN